MFILRNGKYLQHCYDYYKMNETTRKQIEKKVVRNEEGRKSSGGYMHPQPLPGILSVV